MEPTKIIRIKSGLYADQNASIIRFDQDRGTVMVRILKGFKNGGQAMWQKFDDVDFDYEVDAPIDVSREVGDTPIEETHTEPGSFEKEWIVFEREEGMSRRDKIILSFLAIVVWVVLCVYALSPKEKPQETPVKSEKQLLMEEINRLNLEDVPDIEAKAEIEKRMTTRRAIKEANLKLLYGNQK